MSNKDLLYVAPKEHTCITPLPQPRGSLYQCDFCWVVWRQDSATEWGKLFSPGQRVFAVVLPTGHVVLDNQAGDHLARLDVRGNFIDAYGKPAPHPDLEDPGLPEHRPLIRQRTTETFTTKDDLTAATAQAIGAARKPKHSNGTPDVEVFADQVQTVKGASKLLAEDNDAKKTALGLITIIIVVALVTITALALTGNLA